MKAWREVPDGSIPQGVFLASDYNAVRKPVSVEAVNELGCEGALAVENNPMGAGILAVALEVLEHLANGNLAQEVNTQGQDMSFGWKVVDLDFREL